eukprot:gene10424-12184_t
MAGRAGTDESIRGPGYVGLRQNIATLNERPPFSVGGTLDFSSCAGFVLQISDEEKTVQKDFDIMAMEITEIQSMCVPSAFNDLVRKEWRVDPSVRLAMECPAERMKIISRDSEHSFESNFQEVLKGDLFMGTYSNIEMVPNKLNIYSKGGHFTAHKDSSRVDPDRYLGTLIVALPFEHTGGELYVRNEGQETVYDFSKRSADSRIVQFAAFIGDCEHEVKPVTSGHRVVLTYTLLRPSEVMHVLPSPAILISKTVSKPYIAASAAVPAIPVTSPVAVKTEVVSHSVAAPVYHSGGGLFGDGDDFGYDYGDYDHDCNED